jgi:hypothetical protein
MKLLRSIAVWLLMLTLPLQAVAALTPKTACGDELIAATHSMHGQQAAHHDEAANGHHHHATADTYPAGHDSHDNSSGHSCCHHAFSGVTASVMPLSPVAPHAVVPRVSLLSTLHIPELPQRPPRA